MPPAKAFWSITMYDAKTQLLVENSINRYLVNTSMEDKFVYGDDGSLTIYLQSEPPSEALMANWLPAPVAPFYAVMRLYVPEPEAYEGEWSPPPMVRAGDASVKKA
ncbi:hypothetical protein MYSTI_07048 [Myxococcus stipitatus DSM 14675]|uniref:DUF1214 domain-containing protein n=1 Tax=Myxococcus stipitatus (strain DSM 14675 / JCM 12634 / Mx s8) TaxID=1278073 RepID=L7UK82_MYXSD|nr:hypothetical protein MYSTI_07048 [Myxococcus stipitatus DSM 14675]